jgi:ribosome assembly protein YihI (activator of Der GTPase)
MGFDRHGQLHAGTIGLFDDADELEATERRMSSAREKIERKAEKKIRKEDKRGQRKAEGANRKQHDKEQGISWFCRYFGRIKRNGKLDGASLTCGVWSPPAVPLRVSDKKQREKEEAEARAKDRREEMKMYDAEEVDQDLNSPFYQELGFVMVRGESAIYDRVVHKSQIRPARNEKQIERTEDAKDLMD